MIAESSCASEGVVEVLVEPQVPRPLLVIVGDSNAAITLAELARTIDWRVATEQPGRRTRWSSRRWVTPTRRRWRLALGGRAGYVGLVASARRAAVVLGALRARGSARTIWRVCTARPGSISGPATQPEIAVAILAELVAWRHTRVGGEPVLLEAIDPVCGMTVAVGGAGDAVVLDGVSYYFCSCRLPQPLRGRAVPLRDREALSLQAARIASTRLPGGLSGYDPGGCADGSCCQRPKSFPSVSVQVANQPMPGTGMRVASPRRRAPSRARRARVDVVDVEVDAGPALGRCRPP